MKRAWPDLHLRARIARERRANMALDSVADKLMQLVVDRDEERDEDKYEAAFDEADIEERAAHVRNCSNCKAFIAKAARKGKYIPEKLLIAAGVEILRN